LISFSRQVKEEIVFNEFDECCKRALLLAILKINGNLSLTSQGLQLQLRTENAKIASKVHKLLKDIYQPQIEFLVSKKMKLRKNNVYILRITKAKEILDDLQLLTHTIPSEDILRKDCCARAYLAGAFLAGGSVNDPSTSNYHLEVSCQNHDLALYIKDVMNRFDLKAKYIERRNKDVIYIKSAEKIGDFLRIVCAQKSLMDFENQRIDRDFSNNINRWDNCVIANEMKTMQAGASQIADIEVIDAYNAWSDFDEKTVIIAKIRKENPDVSLAELANIYVEETGKSISKSGINHQLKKIKEKANQYRLIHKE
jgi:DNA-binding protein WhiA